jgi:Clp amino terminal domain, pathogenicity island component
LRHNYIGTEHLLLGLARLAEGMAAEALALLGVSLVELRARVTGIIGHGDVVAPGQIPFTSRAKKVLELSLREALGLGHNYIGTEHLLLALVREHEGVAARVLLDYGLDENTVRDAVIGLLSGALVESPEPYEPKTPPVAAEVASEIARLTEATKSALDEQDFEQAATLKDRQRRLSGTARALEAAWEGRDLAEGPFVPRDPSLVHGMGAWRARRMPRRVSDYAPGAGDSLAPAFWFLLGAIVLAAGLLVGWLIWG